MSSSIASGLNLCMFYNNTAVKAKFCAFPLVPFLFSIIYPIIEPTLCRIKQKLFSTTTKKFSDFKNVIFSNQ